MTTILFDASALGLAGCIRRLKWTVIDGYRKKLNNNDIEFGTAIHKFRAIYRQLGKAGIPAGVKAAQDHMLNTEMYVKPNKKHLTPEFAVNVCLFYAQQYPDTERFEPIRIGEEAIIEKRFVLPYLVVDDFEVLLVGTIDEIGKFKNGITAVCDLKTTSVWNVDEYLESYFLSHQLLFYAYILQRYANEHQQDPVAELCKFEVGNFIDAIFLPANDDPTKIKFERSQVFIFKPETLREFERLLYAKVMYLVNSVKEFQKTGEELPREGIVNQACQRKFGPCEFFDACKWGESETSIKVMDRNFVKIEYNPLLFQA